MSKPARPAGPGTYDFYRLVFFFFKTWFANSFVLRYSCNIQPVRASIYNSHIKPLSSIEKVFGQRIKD
jgi:hypothetical protein